MSLAKDQKFAIWSLSLSLSLSSTRPLSPRFSQATPSRSLSPLSHTLPLPPTPFLSTLTPQPLPPSPPLTIPSHLLTPSPPLTLHPHLLSPSTLTLHSQHHPCSLAKTLAVPLSSTFQHDSMQDLFSLKALKNDHATMEATHTVTRSHPLH